MSAAYRSLARLPIEVYADLIQERGCGADDDGDDVADNPEALRRKICNKLKKFPVQRSSRGARNSSGRTSVSYESITTVGQLLTRISKRTLMKVLDPILTYEECDIFIRRVACACAPRPKSAFDLLQETQPIVDLIPENDNNDNAHRNQQQQPQQFTGEVPFTRMRYLPTGLHSLDHYLKGGLRVGTITELVGQAGSGKTQIAMQLCVTAARYRQGCVYMDTEKKLSLLRLQEMAERRAAANNRAHGGLGGLEFSTGSTPINPHFSYNQPPNQSFLSATSLSPQKQRGILSALSASPSSSLDSPPYQRAHKVLDNVNVMNPTTMQDLMSDLVEVEELILMRNHDATDANIREGDGVGNLGRAQSPHNHDNRLSQAPPQPLSSAKAEGAFPIRLLIVDSIAAPTKRGPGYESPAERASAIFQFAQRLKRLAHELQLAVLVINQVYADHRRNNNNYNNEYSNNHHHQYGQTNFKAALGTSWHHCVSTRIMLEQRQQQENFDPNQRQHHLNPAVNGIATKTMRTARIEKSIVSGFHSTEYEIVGAGVVDVEGTASSSP